MAAVLKTVELKGSGGSNPSASAKIEKNRGWIIFCDRNQDIGYPSKDLDFYRTVSILSDNTDFNEFKLLRLSGEYVFKIRI